MYRQQALGAEVGSPVWTGVRQLFGEVMLGMTQSSRVVVRSQVDHHPPRTVVVAVDISTGRMNELLDGVNLTAFGGSSAVVSGPLSDLLVVTSSTGNSPFAFDSIGSLHQIPASQRLASLCLIVLF